jgi:hypothetical protein
VPIDAFNKHFAKDCAAMVGSPMAFVLTVVIVMTWVVYFAYSDAWQLVKYRYDHCDFPHGVSEIVMARWSTRN